MKTVASINVGLLLLVSMMVNVQAAPIYKTVIVDTGFIIAVDQGTDFAEKTTSSQTATAQIVNNEILLNVNKAPVYTSGLRPIAYMIFNDVVFTDTNNPGATGNVNVSLNFMTTVFDNIVLGGPPKVEMRVGLLPVSAFAGVPSDPQTNLFFAKVVEGIYSTATIAVPLNEAMSLSIYSQISPFGGFTGAYGELGAKVEMRADKVFNLGSGITVNSVDAGIVDNRLAAVPVPASIWLFGSGLIGLTGLLRRKNWSN